MTGRVIIAQADARHLPLPGSSADLVVCSPPYFQLREYTDDGQAYAGQLGGEATPAEYITALMECTREWVRVLKPGGSLFVNIGDRYSNYIGGKWGKGRSLGGNRTPTLVPVAGPENAPSSWGIPAKSLMGLPARYQIACIDMGLICRAQIIWHKTTAMPESAADRVHVRHEVVLHFTRRPRYFADLTAICEPFTEPRRPNGSTAFGARDEHHPRTSTGHGNRDDRDGVAPGSVWLIPMSPLRPPASLGVKHYATFPVDLARRVIAGWSPRGICTSCGDGRRRVPSAAALDMRRPQARRARQLADRAGLTDEHLAALVTAGLSDTPRGTETQAGAGPSDPEMIQLASEARAVLGGYAREFLMLRPSQWADKCACPDTTAPVRPAVVVDPCGGSGTTALAASVLGRTGISFDLSHDYGRLAAWRTGDRGERARAAGLPRPRAETAGQGDLLELIGGEAS